MNHVVFLAWARLPKTAARQHPQLRLMAHALRDALIAQQCDCPPETIQIEQRNRSSKPELVVPQGWCFSLSHSRDAAVVALAHRPVGVDLEYLDRKANWPGLAKRSFHTQERAQLQVMPSPGFERAALQLWTAKEAWSKALGVGVAGFQALPSFTWRQGLWQPPGNHGFVARPLDADLWCSLALPGYAPVDVRWQRADLDLVGGRCVVSLPGYEIIKR